MRKDGRFWAAILIDPIRGVGEIISFAKDHPRPDRTQSRREALGKAMSS